MLHYKGGDRRSGFRFLDVWPACLREIYSSWAATSIAHLLRYQVTQALDIVSRTTTEQMPQSCKTLFAFMTSVCSILGVLQKITICIRFAWVTDWHRLIIFLQDECMQPLQPDNPDRCGDMTVLIFRRGEVVQSMWRYNAIYNFFLDGERLPQEQVRALSMTSKHWTKQFDTTGLRHSFFERQFNQSWKELQVLQLSISTRP